MEMKNKESTSFDGTTYILTFESFEMSLKKNEATSIVDKRPLGLCDSTEKIKSSSFKGKCSKSCTKSRKTSSNGLQTSDKPQTLRESSYRQKNSETKPTGEMPLFAQLKTKMKETSRKLQSTLPFFKKTTKRTMTRVRSLYVGSRAKRVLGFKCDLKKCNSTLMDCSAGACRKKSMIFSESNQPCSSKTIDRSVSDTSIKSSSSEDSSSSKSTVPIGILVFFFFIKKRKEARLQKKSVDFNRDEPLDNFS